MLAAFAFLVIAQPAAADAVPGSWGLCQQDIVLPGEVALLVNLVVDEQGRATEQELALSGDFEASWSLGPRPLAAPGAMTSFAYFMDVDADARFPVTISATADGRLFWRGEVAAPNLNNGDVHGGVRPMLLVGEQGAGRFPNIFGVRRLSFVATGADGRAVAQGVLRLPDWRAVERLARRAALRNELQRRTTGCAADELPV